MAVTVQERKLLLDGEWIETGEWQDVDSPYSGRNGRARGAGGRGARTEGARCGGACDELPPSRPRARRDPRPRRRASAGAARRGRADHLRRGRQADEGRPGRGRARRVHVHDGRGRGAPSRRRGRPDGRLRRRGRQGRLHDARADRDRRRHHPLQLPAQPRRTQGRPRTRRRLCRRAEARRPHAALRAPAGRARDRGRAPSRLAQRPRRALRRDRRRHRRGRAREADHVHRLLGRRLEDPRAGGEEACEPRARQRDPGGRRGGCRHRGSGDEARRERVLLRRPELHLRPADLRQARGVRRLRLAFRPEGAGAQGRRPGRGGHRRGPGHRRGRPRAHRLLGRGGEVRRSNCVRGGRGRGRPAAANGARRRHARR